MNKLDETSLKLPSGHRLSDPDILLSEDFNRFEHKTKKDIINRFLHRDDFGTEFIKECSEEIRSKLEEVHTLLTRSPELNKKIQSSIQLNLEQYKQDRIEGEVVDTDFLESKILDIYVTKQGLQDFQTGLQKLSNAPKNLKISQVADNTYCIHMEGIVYYEGYFYALDNPQLLRSDDDLSNLGIGLDYMDLLRIEDKQQGKCWQHLRYNWNLTQKW